MISAGGLFIAPTGDGKKRGLNCISVNEGSVVGRLEWPQTAAAPALPHAAITSFSQTDFAFNEKIPGQKKAVERVVPAGEHFAIYQPSDAFDILVCRSGSLSLHWAVKLAPKSACVSQLVLLSAGRLLVLLEDGSCLLARKPQQQSATQNISVIAEGEQVVPRAAGGEGNDVGSLSGPLSASYVHFIDATPLQVHQATKGADRVISIEVTLKSTAAQNDFSLILLTEAGAIRFATLKVSTASPRLEIANFAASSALTNVSRLVRSVVHSCPYWITAPSKAISHTTNQGSCVLGYIQYVSASKAGAPVAIEVDWSALQTTIKAEEAIQSVILTSCEILSNNMACIGVKAFTGGKQGGTSCALAIYATFFEGDSGLCVDTSVAVASSNDAHDVRIVSSTFDADSSIHTLVRETKTGDGVLELSICHTSTMNGAPRGRLQWQEVSLLESDGGTDSDGNSGDMTFNYLVLTPDGKVPVAVSVNTSVHRHNDIVSHWPNAVLGFVQLVRLSVDAASIERLLKPFHPSIIRNGLRKAGNKADTTFSVPTLFHLVVAKLQERSVVKTCPNRSSFLRQVIEKIQEKTIGRAPEEHHPSFLELCGGAMEIATQLLTLQHQLGDRVRSDDLDIFVSLLRSVRPLGQESLSTASRLFMVLRAAEAQAKREEEERDLEEERHNIESHDSGRPAGALQVSSPRHHRRRAATHLQMYNKIAPSGAGEVAAAIEAHSAGFEAELKKMESLLVTPAKPKDRVVFMGMGCRQSGSAQDRYEASIGN